MSGNKRREWWVNTRPDSNGWAKAYTDEPEYSLPYVRVIEAPSEAEIEEAVEEAIQGNSLCFSAKGPVSCGRDIAKHAIRKLLGGE